MLLTLPAAAARLSLSRRTLEREIAAGRLAVVQLRGAVRIDENDLSAYIDRSKHTRRPPCPSENAAIDGMSEFKAAARESKEALGRLLRKRTPSTTNHAYDKT